MKRYRVNFRPAAQSDLFDLYEYIADEAGTSVANGYIERIEAACLDLETFPKRGARRDDLRPGVRILGFERRATIIYRVSRSEVLILRVLHAGRDYAAALLAREG